MKCMICNKEFKYINSAHLSSHNITLDEDKEMFPGAETISLETREKMRKATVRIHTGMKRSIKSRKRMSEVRKKKIANGDIITPFMCMDKRGENNPTWGSKYHTSDEIKAFKEHNSNIMIERITNGIHSSSYTNGKFLSAKNNKDFLYRSSYELRMLNILEHLDCIVNYQYEKIAIPYMFGGITHNYIPDFLIEFNDGTIVLCEIGPSTFKIHKNAREKAKQESALEYCRENNINFTIITDDSINRLEDEKNRVNCWDDLKSFCHNVIGNDKREGLKNKEYMVNQQPNS